MNLHDFERRIEPRILDRGRQYFDDGRVLSIEETDSQAYEALVDGTDCYTVSIVLDDAANIRETACDCPYDMGEYCKHQVAAFLALRELLDDDQERSPRKPASERSSRKSTPKQNWRSRLEQTLKQQTKDELIHFLINISANDETIRHQAELRFNVQDDPAALEQSIHLIRSHIQSAADRRGFIDYSSTRAAIKGAQLVLEKARNAYDQGKRQFAMDLALIVMHEMMMLLEACDDSSGFVGMTIEEGIRLLETIVSRKDIAPAERERLFGSLLAEASHRRYEDWNDWQIDLLNCCARLVNTPALRTQMDKQLAAMAATEKTDTFTSRYRKEKFAMIQYEMVKRLDGKAVARTFIADHLAFTTFRKMAIDDAMLAEDYETVIRLARDGEALDREYSGRVREWQKIRYMAYQRSGQLDRQRELALAFIMDDKFEYYQELKKTYSPAEWATIYPDIIQRFEQEKVRLPHTYTHILIEENEKERLLRYVQRNPSSIEGFAHYLLPEYRETVHDLFLRYIEQTAAAAENRAGYQAVCSIIQNLKKAGGRELARKIKEDFMQKYKHRPAFKDELSKI